MPVEITSGRVAVYGFATLVLAMGIGRFAFTPLLPMMQSDGLVSVSGGGVLASVHFVGYAMGALLAGRLNASPGLLLFGSLAAIGGSTAVMGVTADFTVWLIARWLAGVCSAIVLVVVSTYFVKELARTGRADLQGWVFAGVGGGITIAGLVTLLLMAAGSSSVVGWHVLGIGALIAAAIIYFGLDGSRLLVKAETQSLTSEHTRLNWRVIVPYGAMGAGYIIPATYLPIMAQQAVSSPLVFGWSWPVFGLAAAVSTLITARLITKYSNRQIWVVGQLIMALGLVLPALWQNLAAVIVAGICVGGTFMVITMVGLREAHLIGEGGCPAAYCGDDGGVRRRADHRASYCRLGLRSEGQLFLPVDAHQFCAGPDHCADGEAKPHSSGPGRLAGL